MKHVINLNAFGFLGIFAVLSLTAFMPTTEEHPKRNREAPTEESFSRHAIRAELHAALAIEPTFSDCRARCRECTLRPWYTEAYLMPIGSEGGWRDDVVYSCADAPCPEPSNDCPGDGGGGGANFGGSDVDLLWSAAASGDRSALETAIRSYEEVVFNTARGSLQVMSCSGSVIVNIPVDAVTAQALLDQ